MRMLPMLTKTSVVQSILAGRQVQDRRPMKPQPKEYEDRIVYKTGKYSTLSIPKPDAILPINAKYQVGDIIYVRETFAEVNKMQYWGGVYGDYSGIRFRADDKLYHACCGDLSEWKEAEPEHQGKWKPSIHMPKKFARIFLKVTNVRCERIKSISLYDVASEGILPPSENSIAGSFDLFQDLWESIYPGSWDKNEFVFVYDFELTDKP